jgi:hypothetical protein
MIRVCDTPAYRLPHQEGLSSSASGSGVAAVHLLERRLADSNLAVVFYPPVATLASVSSSMLHSRKEH